MQSFMQRVLLVASLLIATVATGFAAGELFAVALLFSLLSIFAMLARVKS
jgi:hypothetical protein